MYVHRVNNGKRVPQYTCSAWNDSLPGIQKEKMIMEKMMNTKTEGNTFTKKIGQTVYVVRYHFNEDAKETMQEKINRMLVTEVSRQAVY